MIEDIVEVLQSCLDTAQVGFGDETAYVPNHVVEKAISEIERLREYECISEYMTGWLNNVRKRLDDDIPL
jgi:hypothetical protein